jgi:hypothetical protein
MTSDAALEEAGGVPVDPGGVTVDAAESGEDGRDAGIVHHD